MPNTDTTLHPHDYHAIVAAGEHEGALPSALGAGCCQMCGASPCVCDQLDKVPLGTDWWIGADGNVAWHD